MPIRRALILAAGLGTRIRSISNTLPKPMLPVCGKPLIEHQIIRLRDAGVCEIVINLSWQGEQIKRYLGDGSQLRVALSYSEEGSTPLGSGGGIYHALPLLGEAPFLVVNSDIWSDYPYSQLVSHTLSQFAHLILVENPPHCPAGDFSCVAGRIFNKGKARYTFSGIGLYLPELFGKAHGRVFSLTDVLRPAIDSLGVTGEVYRGTWHDIGTPERYHSLLATYQK